jgi:diguanylate cyclase (GGDEF)-like protein
VSEAEPTADDRLRRLELRFEREHRARLEAEAIAEKSTSDLYKKHQELLLLQRVASASNEALSIDEAFQTVLDLVCTHMRWPIGHVYIPTRTGNLCPTGIWHLDDEDRFEAFRTLTEATPLAPGVGLPGRCYRDRKPLWIVDVTLDANFPRAKSAVESGVRAGFAFPVVVGSDLVAVAEFFMAKAAEPDETVLALMTDIGIALGRVVERERAKAKLIDDAFHDPLTGLPNRALFVNRLEHVFELAGRNNLKAAFAVLYLDLDRFKVVNDSLGHQAGDELLRAVAVRLATAVRRSDTFARLGGDEFGVLIEGLRDVSDAMRVAQHIGNALSAPFMLGAQKVFATVSIGIAYHDTRYEKPGDLLRDADIAMYRAKEQGKARHQVFDREMQARARSRLELESSLRQVVTRQELRLHYQPVVSLKTLQVVDFEALVRWQHPEMGLVPPGKFIPMAEETGLIIEIGSWVIEEGCRQLQKWRLAGLPQSMAVTVNLSARQLSAPNIVDEIKRIGRDTGLSLDHLKLEITESAVIEQPERAAETLKELKRLGVGLLLDDFGTGYSSLSYLHQFPIDVLKIDGSFVRKLEAGNKNAELVRTIVVLAKNLGMEVIAECVETYEQLELLRELGCEYVQGYFFSKAVEAGAAMKLAEQPFTMERPRF